MSITLYPWQHAMHCILVPFKASLVGQRTLESLRFFFLLIPDNEPVNFMASAPPACCPWQKASQHPDKGSEDKVCIFTVLY